MSIFQDILGDASLPFSPWSYISSLSGLLVGMKSIGGQVFLVSVLGLWLTLSTGEGTHWSIGSCRISEGPQYVSLSTFGEMKREFGQVLVILMLKC